MSISEYGGITDGEMKALMVLRSQRFAWVSFSQAVYPDEFRALCRRLALRGYAELRGSGDSEAASITRDGMEATMTPATWAGEAA